MFIKSCIVLPLSCQIQKQSNLEDQYCNNISKAKSFLLKFNREILVYAKPYTRFHIVFFVGLFFSQKRSKICQFLRLLSSLHFFLSLVFSCHFLLFHFCMSCNILISYKYSSIKKVSIEKDIFHFEIVNVFLHSYTFSFLLNSSF